jgi:hypothetical protein
LTFDEFGMWLNPSFQRGTRWNVGGLEFVIIALAFVGLLPLLFRRQPDSRQAELAGGAQARQRAALITDLTD